jgi:hypothetical protein
MPRAKKKTTRKKAVPSPEPAREPIVSGSSVIVCHEKQEFRYYTVVNDDDLFVRALEILRGRLMSNWYPAPGDRPEELDFTKDDIGRLPPSFRQRAEDELRRYELGIHRWSVENDSWTDIQEACSAADGALAWKVLMSRSDLNYERIVLVEADRPYEYTEKDPDYCSRDRD